MITYGIESKDDRNVPYGNVALKSLRLTDRAPWSYWSNKYAGKTVVHWYPIKAKRVM